MLVDVVLSYTAAEFFLCIPIDLLGVKYMAHTGLHTEGGVLVFHPSPPPPPPPEFHNNIIYVYSTNNTIVCASKKTSFVHHSIIVIYLLASICMAAAYIPGYTHVQSN